MSDVCVVALILGRSTIHNSPSLCKTATFSMMLANFHTAKHSAIVLFSVWCLAESNHLILSLQSFDTHITA